MSKQKKLRLLGGFVFVICLIPAYRSATAIISEFSAQEWQPRTDLLIYKSKGAGKHAVLFLHGLAGTSTYFGNRFGTVPEDFVYYAPDLLGFGDSPKPKGPYSLDMHRQAVELFIKEVILPSQPESIQLVGHSLGALIALELLKNRSVPVLNTVLIGTPLYTSPQVAAEKIGSVGMMYKGMALNSFLITASCFFRDSYRLPILASFFKLPQDVYLGATEHSWTSLHGTLHNSVMNFPLLNYGEIDGQFVQMFHAVDDEVAPIGEARAYANRISAAFNELSLGGHQLFLTNPDVVFDSIIEPRGVDGGH